MAITAERLIAEVRADTSQAEKGLDKFSDKTEKSSGGMKAMKAAVVGFAGAAVSGIAGKAVMAASDLNEVVSKTGVVFGQQTDDVTGFAQQMADKFGLPKTAVLDAASSFGLLGKAAGLTGTDVSKMSTGLAGLAADAMSFYNVPLEQALEDFRSGLSGEAEPLRKYGVLINEAAVQSEALAMGLVKPVKNAQALKAAQVGLASAQANYSKAVKEHGADSLEAQKAQVALSAAQDKVAKAAKGAIPPLTEAQKVQARASLITKGMKDASGDLARTQGSVSNRIKEVQGRIANYAADIGQKALPAVAALLGAVIGLMGGLSDAAGFISEHSTLFKILAGVITTVLLPRFVAMGVSATVNAAKSVAAWVSAQVAAIKSSWQQVAAAGRVIGGWVKSAAAATASAARTVGAWVSMGVAATVNAAKMATAWVVGIIRQAAVSAAAMAVAAARVVGGWVLMGVQSMIQAARMAAAWFIALGPVGWVIAAVIGLVALIIANWDTVVKWTQKAWTWVRQAIETVWNWIKTAAVAYFTFYKTIITGAWNAIRAVTTAVWNAIKTAIGAAWNWIKSRVTTTVNGVKSTISAAWNWVKSTTTSAWNAIKTGVSRAVSAVLAVVRGIPGKIKSALGNLGSLLLHSGERIMDGLAQGIRNGLGNVKRAVEGVLQRARDLLPFSPAKEGPFSGKGWTLYSGRSISDGLAEGIGDRVAQVRKAALGLAQAAVPRVGGITAPTVSGSAASGPGRADSEAVRVTPDSIARQGSPGAGQTVVFNTYYPVAEKQSQTVNRSLQKVAALQMA